MDGNTGHKGNTRKESIIIHEDGVGEIKYGMSTKELKKITGLKCKQREKYDDGSPIPIGMLVLDCKYGLGDLVLVFDVFENDSLYGITITDSSYRSAKGIGVGSTYSEVVQAYKKEPKEQLYYPPEICIYIASMGLTLWFDHSTLDINSIYDKEKGELKGELNDIFKDTTLTKFHIGETRTCLVD